jgi:hypothetical protein
MNTETLKLAYFAYFHSIMPLGIIFGQKFKGQQNSILHPKENH